MESSGTGTGVLVAIFMSPTVYIYIYIMLLHKALDKAYIIIITSMYMYVHDQVILLCLLNFCCWIHH